MSVASTVIAEPIIDTATIINAEEVVHKSFIQQIQYRVKHNIIYIQNHIQILENNLAQEEAKLDIINEILGEVVESDESSLDYSENNSEDEIVEAHPYENNENLETE